MSTETDQQSSKRQIQGSVVSASCDKSITVMVERKVKHPLYKKYIKRHAKVYAHDEKGEARPGDLVRIVEGRPTSKLKRFWLVEVLKPAQSEG